MNFHDNLKHGVHVATWRLTIQKKITNGKTASIKYHKYNYSILEV
jgi:hypothetical protein